MIRRLFTSFLVLVLMAGSSVFAASNFTITSSTSGSSTKFIVTRSGEGTNAAETVRYRTVSCSAFAGRHFVEGAATALLPRAAHADQARLRRGGLRLPLLIGDNCLYSVVIPREVKRSGNGALFANPRSL